MFDTYHLPTTHHVRLPSLKVENVIDLMFHPCTIVLCNRTRFLVHAICTNVKYGENYVRFINLMFLFETDIN